MTFSISKLCMVGGRIVNKSGAAGAMRIGKENRITWENPPQTYFLCHKFHMLWPGFEPRPSWWKPGYWPQELFKSHVHNQARESLRSRDIHTYIHTFLTSAPEGGEWLSLTLWRLYLWKMIHRRLFDIEDETQGRSGSVREEKNSCTWRKSNAGLSIHSLVTTLTELSANLPQD
jgi:hypothetical protein